MLRKARVMIYAAKTLKNVHDDSMNNEGLEGVEAGPQPQSSNMGIHKSQIIEFLIRKTELSK